MSDEAAINVEELDNMTGGIPELCRRTSQPYDYSEKQLEEKTHVPTIETVRVHGDSGKHNGGCGKPGCKCDPCECGASCKCGESGQGSKANEGGKPCGKPNCKCEDCKCGSSCSCD